MRMSTLLNEVRNFELDEGFSPKEIKMAIGIASDPRYAKGNMTGAVNAIEKMKKGLSKHPQVAAVLKRQNEKVETDEAVSPAQQAAIAISKKERGEKPKKEGNTFGKELKAARDKGEKTFVVGGKTYNVEDYDIKEDGHTDVASAVRQCKTMIEDAMQISSKLQSMNPEDSLPSWWTNKLAISSNSMNKLRDYFLVPSNVTEELQEAMGDLEDLKKMVAELQKASQMHLGQSKRVQAHVDMMSKMEETELDEEPYVNTKSEYLVLIDKDNKIVAEFEGKDPLKDAKDSVRSAHLPPMSIPKNEVSKMRIVRMNKSGRKDRGRQIGDKLGALAVGLKVKVGKMELDEEISINELKMNDPRLNKIFDKLKPKSTVQIKTSSSIAKGQDFKTYLVVSKNTLRNGTEKITLKNRANPTGVKSFLYRRDGKITFAIGDMGASIDDIKEMAYKPGSFKDTRPQEKTAKALDDLIMKGGVDKNDYRKVRILYVQASDPKSRNRVKDFIYNLDTEPKEEIMNVIGMNDPETFLKMYPNAKKGQPLTTVSFAHRSMKSEGLEEKYDLYHKDFSSAMQHAYDYAKKKMGITVDPKEIDSKVATGPKKPTEGKTNKYRLKGKGGNLQIQVYNKGGSKPFELNMYKEELELIEQVSNIRMGYQTLTEKVDPADVDDTATDKDIENAGKNIIMQLRKSVSMRGNKDVEFADGKKKVDMRIAQKAIDMHMRMRTSDDKLKFQNSIAKSYKDLLNTVKGK